LPEKIDSVSNYIPSRLTALLMIIVSGRFSLLSFIKKYGREHASPNSGYPEAALAGILDCRFGGTHDYFGESVYKPYIGDSYRDFNYSDVLKAIAVNREVEASMILIACGIRLLFLL
ncbi:MAG: cobalamin biosynthesis protein, partial [Muribaculaceae bacterium]|nr:cobalamin biosynthesis protein [Muribaculaceae bacterium]